MANRKPGDRRIGVVWHTRRERARASRWRSTPGRSSGAGAIIREPAMGNPTIVVLTDRNDLDEGLRPHLDDEFEEATEGEEVAVMQERHEICCGLLGGFDRSRWTTGSPSGTSPSNYCRSCSRASWPSGGARTSCRRGRSPKCWNRVCAATRTGLSRPHPPLPRALRERRQRPNRLSA